MPALKVWYPSISTALIHVVRRPYPHPIVSKLLYTAAFFNSYVPSALFIRVQCIRYILSSREFTWSVADTRGAAAENAILYRPAYLSSTPDQASFLSDSFVQSLTRLSTRSSSCTRRFGFDLRGPAKPSVHSWRSSMGEDMSATR